MKIESLQLIAFGPFTGRTLDFSDHPGAFHLVYGPNEAGKSTALRALRGMLFGIPVRTSDSFRHPHPKLRIGAELILRNGEKIAFIRRKGQRRTLRGADDRSLLDEDVLSSFLGGIDQALFEQMFAIGHSDLVQGGQEIIAGGGRIGQALFTAGAGLIALQRFQQHLDHTMETLFKPSGSNPRINRILTSLKNTRKDQRDALLLGKTWKTHYRNLQDATTRQAANQQRLTECKQAYGMLERIHEALPLIARRKEIGETLRAFEHVPDLPEDFSENRRQVENALAIATNDVQRAQDRMATIQAKIDTLSVPAALLRQAHVVETLQHDLGSYKKARQDRPVLEARMRALDQQATAKLSQMGITTDLATNANHLRLTPAVIGELQELGKTHERLTTRLDANKERRRQLETDITTLEDHLKRLPPQQSVAAIKALLQTIQDEGPLEKQIAETRDAVHQREKTLSNQLKRQTLWTGSLENLGGLPWPSRESVDRFEKQFAASTRQMDRLKEDNALVAEKLAAIDTELQTIAIGHDVPTEENLRSARSLRDTGWHLIRRRVEGNDPAEEDVQQFTAHFANHQALPDAFEASMEKADHISDRLRREAEQVSRKSMLAAQKAQAEKEYRETAARLDAVGAEQRMVAEQWEGVWAPSGIQPLTPAEMRAWLSDMTAIREKAADLALEKEKVAARTAAIETLKARLAAALDQGDVPVPADHTMAGLIGIARHHVESQEALGAQIAGMDSTLRQHRKALQKVNSDIDDTENDLDRWKGAWGQHVGNIGLTAEASPTAAMSVIENIREAQRQRDEADILKKRIQGIDRDADAFMERVTQLVNRLSEKDRAASPEEASLLLNAKLTEAREAQSRHTELQRQLDAAHTEHAAARKRLEDATTRMQSLCREARCTAPDMLPEIESRSRKRRHLMEESRALESRLRRLSAGATVDAFVTEAEAVAPDSLAPEMERLAEDITALERERSELDQTIGTEKAELKRMDGRAAAAGHAEDAERLLAGLESDVAQYARTKIASAMLARTIERYREKHQGPLIKRASQLFARMTLNAFQGVRAEYDGKGNPILVGIRSAGDESVTVEGMSDGTADQLYLALRLAGLEHYLENREPLPFVVDDILLRFDDERARATLEVLVDLSDKTQVIFFTHHHHLVELAQSAIGAARLTTHLLSDPPAVAQN
jgi:uncharacterized protein YhaN